MTEARAGKLPPNWVVYQAIAEERLNQREHSGEETGWLPPLFGRFRDLLENLAARSPNRIYYSPEGRIGKLLFFSEPGDQLGTYMEPSKFDPTPGTLYGNGDLVLAPTAEGLEEHIETWRKRMGFAGELLTKPERVLRVRNDRETFVHLALTTNPEGYRNKYPLVMRYERIGGGIDGIYVSELYLATPEEPFVESARYHQDVEKKYVDLLVQSLKPHTHPFEQ